MHAIPSPGTTPSAPGVRRRAAAATAALLAASAAAVAGDSVALRPTPPRGPEFGSTRIESALGPDAGDVDTYAASLAAGERLQVALRADAATAATFGIDGPDDVARDPALRVRGAGVRAAPLAADATGTWTVHVRGGDVGAYVLRTRITHTRRRIAHTLDGPGVVPFEAVDGSRVDARVRTRRGAAAVLRVLDPEGHALAVAEGRPLRIAHELFAGDGTYALAVATAEGSPVRVRLRVRGPAGRPRGRLVVPAAEPRLDAGDEPLEGVPGRSVRIPGARLAVTPQLGAWFGGLRASVVKVDAAGLTVVPPLRPAGTLVDVVVADAFGQTAALRSAFSYAEPPELPSPPPPELRILRLEPDALELAPAATAVVEVVLDAPAPAGGVFVDLAADPDPPATALGTLPSRVRIATGRTSVSVLFRAAEEPADGWLLARLGAQTLRARVRVAGQPEVVPPELATLLDVSGWTLRQANSSRDLVLPQGLVLAPGDYVVVARNCAQPQFEAYWGRSLGPRVHFVDALGAAGVELPVINGSESYTLLDAVGGVRDGPTVAMSALGGDDLRRIAGAPAGDIGSWSVSPEPASAADPGAGIPADATGHGVFVSEFSDAPGAGNYVYEFVELHYSGPPPEE